MGQPKEKKNRVKDLSLLGDTNGLSPATSGLSVLPTNTKTPVVSETTVIPANYHQLHNS